MTAEDASYADRRRAAIEGAAYALLAEKGYKATSMLAIARRAKASNETLYNWYGNKQQLFASLVRSNAKNVVSFLDGALELDGDEDVWALLDRLGPALLTLVTSERAIALNRAAVGDVHDTGTLGKSLSDGGREAVVSRLTVALDRAGLAKSSEIAEMWINLLIGDWQIRLVTGAITTPSEAAMAERSKMAIHALRQLYG